MKMKVKALVAALGAVGLAASLPQALADTITPPATVAPLPNQTVVPTTYAVTYPVTVQLTGQAAQNVNFVYNANGSWTAPAGWTYVGMGRR